jgi:hypothetical protein
LFLLHVFLVSRNSFCRRWEGSRDGGQA